MRRYRIQCCILIVWYTVKCEDDRDFFLSGAGRRGKRGITLTCRVEKKYVLRRGYLSREIGTFVLVKIMLSLCLHGFFDAICYLFDSFVNISPADWEFSTVYWESFHDTKSPCKSKSSEYMTHMMQLNRETN